MAISIVQRFTVFAFGLFFAIAALLRVALVFIFNPKMFRKVERSAPSCLTDKSYGEHGYVRTASNLNFHYVSKGDESKPLMLFVHGFPEFWYSWRHQLSGLDVEYRLVALDLRGYGDSDKPDGLSNYKTNLLVKDIKEFIQALGYNSCVLVAHDWGGVIAWLFAHEYSRWVDKVIILNAPHLKVFEQVLLSNKEQQKKSWYIAFFQVPFVAEFLYQANDFQVFDRIFRDSKMGVKNKYMVTDEDLQAFKYTFGKPRALTPPINYYRNLLNEYEPLGSWCRKISCPVMVIWGTADGALDVGLLDGLEKYVDNLTIRKIIGSSHWIQQDEPHLVNSYIKDFVSFK